ncbi:MAG: hypothetical protein AMXMBFR83_10190 [Phycisphaerae bacterium]
MRIERGARPDYVLVMADLNRPLLEAAMLLAGWSPRRVGRRIITLAQTDSTNAVALASAADPDADGLAVFADYQSAGRGRLGRQWLAPRGAGVLCSVVLRPRTGPGAKAAGGEYGGWLTLASAVAACDAIRRSTDVAPAIKWPNDLRVGRKKLAGILIESRAVEGGGRAWVIGIGINCYQRPGHFPEELREQAASLDLLSDRPVDRVAVARELLRALDETLADLEPIPRPVWDRLSAGRLSGFGDGPFDGDPREDRPSPVGLHARWMAYAEPLGAPVRVRSGGCEYAGRTIAVDPAGGLILQCDDGQRRWFDPLLTSVL